jgi:fatty-acid desaturase
MAYHGMTWRQVDGAALVIRLLAAVGLAWGVKQPPPALVQKRRRHLVPAEADR